MKRWLLATLALSCTEPTPGRVGTVGTADAVGAADAAEPGPELHVCGRQTAAVGGSVDASVLLVMDRSSSMAQEQRWEQTRAAVEEALGSYDRYLRFGLLMYPSGPDQCDEVDRAYDVPIGLGTGLEIAAAMAHAPIYRGTPTGAALRAAHDLLDEDPGEHRAVVLATDGRPNCTGEGWDNGSGLASVESYDATNDLAEHGIPVYVIGIQGSASARTVLNRMADLGGTALAGDTLYYDTESGDEFARALMDIVLDVEGCSLELEAHDDAVRMDVSLNGRTLPRDPANGWTLDRGRLRLNGTSCLAAPGETHEIAITWYCR